MTQTFEDREGISGSRYAMQRRYAAAINLVWPFERIGKVLDVGCGEGAFAQILEFAAPEEVWGIDISKNAIIVAQKRLSLSRFKVADITDIPFSDSSFDLVSCLDVIYYLDQEGRKKAVSELARVLKPQGYLLISTSWPRFTKTRTGQSYIKPKELLRLLGNEFKLENQATTSTLLNLGFMRSGVAMLLRYEPK